MASLPRFVSPRFALPEHYLNIYSSWNTPCHFRHVKFRTPQIACSKGSRATDPRGRLVTPRQLQAQGNGTFPDVRTRQYSARLRLFSGHLRTLARPKRRRSVSGPGLGSTPSPHRAGVTGRDVTDTGRLRPGRSMNFPTKTGWSLKRWMMILEATAARL